MKSLIQAILLLGTTLIFASPLQAQQLLKFHARIGTSANTFSNASTLSKTASFGLLAGGGAEYTITPSLKVLATLDYHQLKGQIDPTTSTTPEYTALTENKITIHMAELTGSGAYKLPLTFLGDLAPYITAGGSIGYNFYTENNKSTEFNYPTYSYQFNSKDNVTSEYAQLLYSVQAGARLEIPLREGIFSGLLFDLRYRRNMNAVKQGLSSAGSTDPADTYADSLMATI
ncbi:MAG TPA: outer membrane beta-barrel protein, partial [Cyclobacteriaceae bacterium]|nr:outer membrane beta-barrel protein [Cyclobacteriaceae bacterium]